METNPKAAALSPEQRRMLQGWLEEFDRTWTEGRLAERVRSLPPPPDPLRGPALAGLVRLDLARCWQAGRRVGLEVYLQAYPELGTADTVAAELVRAELGLRRRFGVSGEPDGMAARFPRHAADLQRWAAQEHERARETVGPRPGRETIRGPAAAATAGQRPSTRAGAGTPSTPHSLPEQFGRYRVLKKLGQGGMGAVYLVHDGPLDRQVALKVPHFAPEDHNVRERFHREARAAATLDHPNLCPIFDVGEIDGIHYLTMAYIEGKPLSAFLHGDKPLPQRQVALLARKLAGALQEAHARGIIHRDLKPSNVMINKRGEPVVMDFGLARRAASGDVRLTATGAVLGTPAYMPPEQVTGDNKALGPSSDVYSLGVLLYEMLAGRLPFDGPVAAVLGQIMVTEPEPPRRHRPELDAALEAICLKAMAKKIADRFASMAALSEALNAYLRGAAPAVAPVLPPDPAPEPPPPRPDMCLGAYLDPAPALLPGPDGKARRTWWRWLAAACAAMLIVGGIVFTIKVSDEATVRIELDEPNAVVSVDGDVITIEKLGEPITLRPGEHELIVKRGDVEVETRKFTLRRGEKQVLILKLLKTVSRPDRKIEPPPEKKETPPDKKEPPKRTSPEPVLPDTVAALVEKLGRGDGWGRYLAAEELRQRGDRTAVPALMKRVADSMVDLYPGKSAALEALKELGPDKVVVALEGALASKVEAVRVWACRELGRERGKESVAALLGAVKADSPAVRAAAARALGRLDEVEARDALLRLLEQDKDCNVRKAAVDALADLGGIFPVEALCKALVDSDAGVRVHVALSLQRLGERSAAEALRKRVADSSWLPGDPDAAGKNHALNALRWLAPSEVTPALQAALEAKSAEVRVWACQALASEPDKEAAALLLGALKADSVKVQAAAAVALGLREETAAVEALGAIAKDEKRTYEVRQAAKQALAFIDKPAAIAELVKGLKDRSGTARRQAAADLEKAGDRSAVPALMKRIADDVFDSGYGSCKAAALAALKKLDPQRVPEALRAALRSKNYGVRAWACSELAAGNRVSVPVLLTCLGDRRVAVRVAGIAALGKHGATQALLPLLADREATVRLAVLAALAAQGGSVAVEACCQALDESEPALRSQAAAHLEQLGAPTALPALMKRVADDRWESNDPYAGGKYNALAALKKLDPQRVTEALLAALRSKRAEVRVWACGAMPENDRPGSAGLVLALADPSEKVRAAAAARLARQADRASVTGLLGTLKDRTAEVRAAAATALGERPEREEKPVVEALTKLLTDSDSGARTAALSALTKGGGASAVKFWIKALGDKDGRLRQLAAESLQALGDRDAVPALVARVADEQWASNDPYSGGKHAALEALRKLDPSRVSEALVKALDSKTEALRAWACGAMPPRDAKAAAGLVAALKDRQTAVRRAAAYALASQEDKDSPAALIEALTDSDGAVRCAAAAALGERKEPSAREPLRRLLTDKEKTVRQAALEALAAEGGAAAVQLWSAALNDAETTIRSRAASRLKALGDKSAAAALEKRVADDADGPYDSDKHVALEALRALAPERALPAVLQALRAKSARVRTWACLQLGVKDKIVAAALVARLKDVAEAVTVRRTAAIMLGNQDDPESASALIAALQDGHAEVRQFAAASLGDRKEKSAREELTKLLKDADTNVRSAAAAALARLDGPSRP